MSFLRTVADSTNYEIRACFVKQVKELYPSKSQASVQNELKLLITNLVENNLRGFLIPPANAQFSLSVSDTLNNDLYREALTIFTQLIGWMGQCRQSISWKNLFAQALLEIDSKLSIERNESPLLRSVLLKLYIQILKSFPLERRQYENLYLKILINLDIESISFLLKNETEVLLDWMVNTKFISSQLQNQGIPTLLGVLEQQIQNKNVFFPDEFWDIFLKKSLAPHEVKKVLFLKALCLLKGKPESRYEAYIILNVLSDKNNNSSDQSKILFYKAECFFNGIPNRLPQSYAAAFKIYSQLVNNENLQTDLKQLVNIRMVQCLWSQVYTIDNLSETFGFQKINTSRSIFMPADRSVEIAEENYLRGAELYESLLNQGDQLSLILREELNSALEKLINDPKVPKHIKSQAKNIGNNPSVELSHAASAVALRENNHLNSSPFVIDSTKIYEDVTNAVSNAVSNVVSTAVNSTVSTAVSNTVSNFMNGFSYMPFFFRTQGIPLPSDSGQPVQPMRTKGLLNQ